MKKPTKTKQKTKTTTSLNIPINLKEAVIELAGEEYSTEAAIFRKLIISGLKHEYGFQVRGNKVIRP